MGIIKVSSASNLKKLLLSKGLNFQKDGGSLSHESIKSSSKDLSRGSDLNQEEVKNEDGMPIS